MTQPTTPARRGANIHEAGFEADAYRRMLEATEARQNLASQREEDEIRPAGAQVGPFGGEVSPDRNPPTRGPENRLSVDHETQECAR